MTDEHRAPPAPAQGDATTSEPARAEAAAARPFEPRAAAGEPTTHAAPGEPANHAAPGEPTSHDAPGEPTSHDAPGEPSTSQGPASAPDEEPEVDSSHAKTLSQMQQIIAAGQQFRVARARGDLGGLTGAVARLEATLGEMAADARGERGGDHDDEG